MKETSKVRTVRDGCVPALLSAAMDKHHFSATHVVATRGESTAWGEANEDAQCFA
ncbi:hypothetical protein [Xanthomonas sp. NCPPB 1325]|uniref:hypothetical protein n=1 Tax=Xanthomonas sp. NCPPB 1325 TaxID=487529 RepID=UPI0035576204